MMKEFNRYFPLKVFTNVFKGYNLEIGDVIRLGRIEYRVIEYRNHKLEVSSMFDESNLMVKTLIFHGKN